jgi:hypothetical protein
MRKRRGRIGRMFYPAIVFVLAAGLAQASEPKIKTFAAGLSYDHFVRTVVWDGDEASSKIVANMFSARAEVGVGKGLVFGLSAGLSLTDFNDLVFNSLPVSLEYGGSGVKGFFLGADFVAPIRKTGDFEISAAGRFVYSSGMSKTWPLEGFAVEGEAKGTPNWMEISLGPRFTYLFFGRVLPYLEVSARWLRADFRMAETLGELEGSEKKQVKGDAAISVTFGVDADVSRHIAVRGKAGIMPFAGGVDSFVSLGILYKF